MGNTIEVKLKEDNPVLKVTETMVEEFKENISMADHSMAGLAKSMDAMRDTCEVLLRQLDKATQLQDSTTGTDSEKVYSHQLACHLLEIINASVSEHKFGVIESLSKLFNFVWNVGKCWTHNTEKSPLVFLVDKYKSDRKSAGVEDGVSFTDLRLRSLKREIKIVQDKYTASERELNNLNKREILYRKEIELLEKENKAQKETIVDLMEKQKSEVQVFDEEMLKGDNSKETTDLKNEILNYCLKQEYEPLKKDMIAPNGVAEEYLNQKTQMDNDLEPELHNLKIDCSGEISFTVGASIEDFEGPIREINLREEIDRPYKEVKALTTKKVLHGYEYDDQTVLTRYKKRIKEDLYESLKRELATCNVNLEISSWYPSQFDGIPTDRVIIVPIFKVSSYETLNSEMQRALKETNAGPNVVVLVFYNANREFVCEEMKKPLLEEFNNIGGIFKFGHFTLKQFKSEINESSYKELLQFLKSKCMEGRYLAR